MKLWQWFILVAIVGLFCHDGRSQQIAIQPGAFANTVQMVPGAVPTSNTCLVGRAMACLKVITSDPYLCAADATASGQTLTVQDVNNVPFISGALTGSWFYASPNGFNCRLFPGGVYVQAGGAGVTGRFTISYN